MSYNAIMTTNYPRSVKKKGVSLQMTGLVLLAAALGGCCAILRPYSTKLIDGATLIGVSNSGAEIESISDWHFWRRPDDAILLKYTYDRDWEGKPSFEEVRGSAPGKTETKPFAIDLGKNFAYFTNASISPDGSRWLCEVGEKDLTVPGQKSKQKENTLVAVNLDNNSRLVYARPNSDSETYLLSWNGKSDGWVHCVQRSQLLVVTTFGLASKKPLSVRTFQLSPEWVVEKLMPRPGTRDVICVVKANSGVARQLLTIPWLQGSQFTNPTKAVPGTGQIENYSISPDLSRILWVETVRREMPLSLLCRSLEVLKVAQIDGSGTKEVGYIERSTISDNFSFERDPALEAAWEPDGRTIDVQFDHALYAVKAGGS